VRLVVEAAAEERQCCVALAERNLRRCGVATATIHGVEETMACGDEGWAGLGWSCIAAMMALPNCFDVIRIADAPFRSHLSGAGMGVPVELSGRSSGRKRFEDGGGRRFWPRTRKGIWPAFGGHPWVCCYNSA
jgi:hypothetical protein